MNVVKKNEFLVENEEHNFQDWTVRYKSSHILPSKCTEKCENDEFCSYCIYEKELHIPHLPEMVFPNNSLEIVHKSGCSIEFNALDALKLVKNENQSVKIACSESWKKARQESGLVNKTIGDFDWTFKTNYIGTYKDWGTRELTDLTIDKNKLMQREKILLYRKLILFEDELHDNGTSFCSVRIIPLALMNDPDEVANLIPLIEMKCEKLSLPT
uniref:TIP41-like protein n=1 Tax=Rhodnius prolixus TaxID=13249 RepID=T1HKF8_RHOPR